MRNDGNGRERCLDIHHTGEYVPSPFIPLVD